jgi:tetratricopeptide (TPR) repeat protein
MLFMSFDWGPSNDERYQVPYAEYALKYYATMGANDTVLQQTPMIDPAMQNYGIIIELPAHIIHKSTDWDLFKLRHFFITLVSFFYIFFGALIAKRITGKWGAAFIAMAFLVLTPRIFGEAFNNPKDPTYTATTLFATWTFFVFYDHLKKLSWKPTFILALGIAASIFVRISGLISVFIFGLFLLLEVYRLYKAKETPDYKKIFIHVVAAGIGGYIIGIIFWPSMLNSPLTQPITALNFLKNLPVSVKNLFEGEYLQSVDIPWYYLPKYFLITNPEIILAGIALGLFFLFPILKKYDRNRVLLILFSTAFPLFLIIYNKTGLLTGWRHGYFIYAPLVVFSAIATYYVLSVVLQKKAYRYVFAGIIAIGLAFPLAFMVRNYPLFYVYFNPSSGGVQKAMGYYELDYYSHGLKPATDWMEKNIPGFEKMKIASNNTFQVTSILKSKYGDLPITYIRYRERNDFDWDYALMTQSFVDAEYLKNGYFPPKGTVKTILVDGVPICAIVKREDKNDYYGKRALNAGHFDSAIAYFQKAIQYDDKNEIAWANMGLAQLQSMKADQSVQSFKKALEISPESMLATNGLGYAYLQTNNLTGAEIIFRHMIEENPGNPEPYNILAQIYQHQGKTESAREYLSYYQQLTGGGR